MREYVQTKNLASAALLSIVVTALSFPRIQVAGLDPTIFLPAAFVGMMLVAGAATAWSESGGMNGLFPKEQLWKGLAIAACTAFCAMLFQAYLTDPVMRQLLSGTAQKATFELRFPSSFEGRSAMIFWSIGFENMFFCVAPMAYFARLSRNRWLAMALAVSFRSFATSQMLAAAGIVSLAPLLLLSLGLHTAMACMLFAYGGLPASTLFFAISSMHILFNHP